MTYLNTRLATLVICPDFSLIFINSFNSYLLNDYWVPAVNYTFPYTQVLQGMVEKKDRNTMQTLT